MMHITGHGKPSLLWAVDSVPSFHGNHGYVHSVGLKSKLIRYLGQLPTSLFL